MEMQYSARELGGYTMFEISMRAFYKSLYLTAHVSLVFPAFFGVMGFVCSPTRFLYNCFILYPHLVPMLNPQKSFLLVYEPRSRHLLESTFETA